MKLLLSILLMLGACYSMAQEPAPSATAGNKTIYVVCGNDLPKKFIYVIERRDDKHPEWHIVGQTGFPNSEAAIKGQLMDMPSAILSVANVSDNVIKYIWEHSRKATVLDSVKITSPYITYALGCAWWDKNVTAPGEYEYRVSKKSASSIQLMGQTEKVTYPAAQNNTVLVPVYMKPGNNGASITYKLPVDVSISTIKMYRSKYLVNNYTEVVPTVLFTSKNKATVAEVTDNSGLKNVPYSYYVVPVDFFGNEGPHSVAINLYNTPQPNAASTVTYFTAQGDSKLNANVLKWKLDNSDDLISVDIYRSTGYDKAFTRIASVMPTETSFTDKKVDAATTYYYSITGNGNYGRSYPSSRVSAILMGTKPNLFAPTNLNISYSGKVVKLTWRKNTGDVRGYYVYRANSYTGTLKQLPKMVLSKDSVLTYYDTIKTAKASVFSYAVASINTSYAIGPVTRRVHLEMSSTENLPIPYNVTAIATDEHVNIFWKNLTGGTIYVSGYRIYRTAMDESDAVVEEQKEISKRVLKANSYRDTLVNNGWHYVYTVKAVGADTTQLSSNSLPASCTLPKIQIPAPGNVMAMNNNQDILVKWDAPFDPSVRVIRIYRAELNGTPKLINDVKVSVNSFLDTGLKGNTTYFYLLSSVNASGKESPLTSSVGIHKQ